jgi:spore coat polysaccharide biosynthesis predicted glycosyltransferase SpsG
VRRLVLLRAASGAGVGMGHVMRTRAVAEALVAEGASPLVVVDDETSARSLDLPGARVVTEAEHPEWTREPARGAWVDGFRDWSDELARLRESSVPSLLVENRGPARERCDQLVYPSLHWVPDPWDRAHAARVLGGPDWVPLLRAVREVPRPAERDVDLLITFGGSDPRGLTERALGALDLRERCVVVAVGHHMAARRRAIRSLARRSDAVRVLSPGSALAPWMARARMALTAVGTSLYELAYLGTPSLVVANHASDREALEWYAAHGPHLPLGIAEELSEEGLRAALSSGMHELERRRAASVPGLGEGALRLAHRLLARAA